MVKKTVEYLKDSHGVNVVEVKLTFPISNEQIIAKVKEALETHKVTLAIFSHITSIPAVILPVKPLIEMCKQSNALVFIDGAHVPGQIPLDIKDLDPDYYVATVHKWLFAPRGAGFLWVNKKHQAATHPTVISFGYLKSFQDEFEWVGTRDMNNYAAVSDAVHFVKQLGLENINTYQRELASWTADYLVRRWNTDLMVPLSMCANMVAVRLPGEGEVDAAKIHDELLAKHNIEVYIYEWEKVLYARVSCQIYNTREDMERLADAVLELRGHLIHQK